ncbi:MAG TPA: hypothetical protein VF313_05010 [Anaerolineaceae bacterium]
MIRDFTGGIPGFYQQFHSAVLNRSYHQLPNPSGLGVLSLASLALVFSAPLTATAAAYQPSIAVSAQYKDILVRGGAVTALTIILNIFGTLGMVSGAIYSAYLFWRKQVLLNRVIGNVLIAAGALSPAMAGSFVKAGLVDILYVSELIGAILMFLGYWLATSKAAIAVPSQSVPVKQS